VSSIAPNASSIERGKATGIEIGSTAELNRMAEMA